MVDSFEKIFKDITQSINPNKAWEEWLDYMIDINLFTTRNQNLDFNGREKQYFELFKAWVQIMYDEVKKETTNNGVTGWSDYLGTFYEENVKTSYHASARGQFFTPPHICDVMAEMTMFEKDYKDEFLMDSCCGSGRFILAGHNKEPRIIGYGIDLDPIACKMAVMNLWVHGCRGTIINGNSLSNEFIQGWKVNQYLGIGLPTPHIEIINGFEEAHQFLGRQPKRSIEYCKAEEETVKKEIQSNLDKFVEV